MSTFKDERMDHIFTMFYQKQSQSETQKHCTAFNDFTLEHQLLYCKTHNEKY